MNSCSLATSDIKRSRSVRAFPLWPSQGMEQMPFVYVDATKDLCTLVMHQLYVVHMTTR